MSAAPSQRDITAPVAVVIVNWNGIDDTIDALDELDKLGPIGPTLHRIVVDNGSTDDSVRILREGHPDVHLVETGENLGFAGGNEAGIRWAFEHLDFGFVLLLNNDVELGPGMLGPLLKACADPEVAAAGPKIFFWERRDLIWAAGGELRLRETVMREFGKSHPDGPQFNYARDVSYLTTCCLLVARDALEVVGLFDPMYFIGVEDADWCHRAVELGYRLRYEPRAVMWHKVAVATGGGYTPFKTFHTGRSNALYVRRHYGLAGVLVFIAWSKLAFVAALGRELPRGNAGAVFAKARGVWQGLCEPMTDPPRL